ncbi:BTB domain-containing protein [Mycena indigotica]|uniref:BTB domain-containing protein n=1 Tax=Mycena indigotica TaxID=2126181 RepID=A0A8H6TDW8_9AGAR|nr:BTB domain-containing protein [Mycena indigotica]KAF7314951.1 BTB domain-containing protein [Mycena indigotica]
MSTVTNAIARSEDLWFSDGSIVIQAGNAQFKVFHGILSLRSPIFRDMLSIPQPADAETIDECPVLRLPDDEADTRNFLMALYHPSHFPAFPNTIDLETLLACLRLAHKYEVEDLLRRALVHLSSGFAMSMSDYVARVTETADNGRSILDKRSWVSEPATLTANILLQLVSTAQTIGIPWILPHIFLWLSEPPLQTNILASLPPEFIRGSSLVNKAVLQSISLSFANPIDIPSCTDPLGCFRQRLNNSNILKAAMDNLDLPLPILFFSAPAEVLRQTLKREQLCQICFNVLIQSHEVATQKFWDDLPGLFGLPSWEELELSKTNAIGPNMFC